MYKVELESFFFFEKSFLKNFFFEKSFSEAILVPCSNISNFNHTEHGRVVNNVDLKSTISNIFVCVVRQYECIISIS